MVIKISHHLKKFILDKYILATIAIGVVLWVIAFGTAYIQLFPLEKNVILHTNFQHEVDAVGSVADIMWLLITFAALFFINQLISFRLYYREKVLAYLISFSGGFIMLVGFMVIYYLASIN